MIRNIVLLMTHLFELECIDFALKNQIIIYVGPRCLWYL